METDAQGASSAPLLSPAWCLEGWQEGEGESYHHHLPCSREILTCAVHSTFSPFSGFGSQNPCAAFFPPLPTSTSPSLSSYPPPLISSSSPCALFFVWSALSSLPFPPPPPSPPRFFSVCGSSGPFHVCLHPPARCSLQAVRSHTRTECKCHGLSGSCALRTCWQKLPPFREVGAELLERFHGASRVMGTNDGKALLPAVRNLKPPSRADLLYVADSPDFCSPNRRTGSPGTRGRACNSSALDLSGCDLLCCGRGHREESVQLEENCLCRFHWCCVVQCHQCLVRKELSLCL